MHHCMMARPYGVSRARLGRRLSQARIRLRATAEGKKTQGMSESERAQQYGGQVVNRGPGAQAASARLLFERRLAEQSMTGGSNT